MTSKSEERTPKFKVVTQRVLDTLMEPELAEDAFDHTTRAANLYEILRRAPDGRVTAIDASWGRGKSDLMWRVAKLHNKTRYESRGGIAHPEGTLEFKDRAIWINPWMHQDTSLLAQIVLECLRRLPEDTTDETRAKRIKWLKGAGKVLLCIGLGVVTKGASIPIASYLAASGMLDGVGEKEKEGLLSSVFSPIVSIFKGQADHEVDGLRNPPSTKSDQTLPERFTELVIQMLVLINEELEESTKDEVEAEAKKEKKTAKEIEEAVAHVMEERRAHRLYIFIDDIDRCLPDKQVHLLEEIHFLTSTNAPVVFLMGLDTSIAAKSLSIHYDSEELDQFLYLDKLIDHRFTLPLAPKFRAYFLSLMEVESLLEAKSAESRVLHWLAKTDKVTTQGVSLSEVYKQWVNDALDGLRGEKNLNPRTWQRVFDLFRIAALDQEHIEDWIEHPALVFAWLVLRAGEPELASKLAGKLSQIARDQDNAGGEDEFEKFIKSIDGQLVRAGASGGQDYGEQTRAVLKLLGLGRTQMPGEWVKSMVPIIAFEGSCRDMGAGFVIDL